MHVTTGTVLLFVVIVLAAIAKLAFKGTTKSKSPYEIVPIMTPNEIEFFGRLNRALSSKFHVFPQVAMSAIIKPRISYNQDRLAYWNIGKKRIDFVVYDFKMRLVCIIELDDKMHVKSRDRERDSWTASAGIQTIRWESTRKPEEYQIRQSIAHVYESLRA